MNTFQYIQKASDLFEKHPRQVSFSWKPFTHGAKWMSDWLAFFDKSESPKYDSTHLYFFYGTFKYFISLLAFCTSLFYFKIYGLLSIPPSVFIFYLVEVHFLFLFPLIIDNIQSPILKSIKICYKMGIIQTTAKVLFIGIYMLSGFISLKNPLKRWHIGCLAVLLWYQQEIRFSIN